MKRTIAITCVLAMMLGGVWAQQPTPKTATPQKTDAVKKKKKATRKKTVAAVAPAATIPAQTMPPVPATLMNSAPVRPKVTLDRGQLTIDAPNSTLSDVLNEVRKATGASIDGASPSERVAVRLGPGDPEQVLAALLRGTPYDYVILGSFGKQGVVTRVLLQTAGGVSAEPSSPVATRQPQPPAQQDMDDSMPDRMPPDDSMAQPNPDQAEQPPAQPSAESQPAQPQQQPTQPQPDANQPKTPEQLFKELQQMEQQKQQQQQQPTK